jgi:hypothetical protein
MRHSHNPCPQSKSTTKRNKLKVDVILFVAFIVFLDKKGCQQNTNNNNRSSIFYHNNNCRLG